jgi:hypothetical protein
MEYSRVLYWRGDIGTLVRRYYDSLVATELFVAVGTFLTDLFIGL